MSRKNSSRSGCKDVFHAFLVKNATYDNPLEIPCLKIELRKPQKLIAFQRQYTVAIMMHGYIFTRMIPLLKDYGIDLIPISLSSKNSKVLYLPILVSIVICRW